MSRIGANTRLLAVIGDPIRHSLSPSIHNYWIDECGLDYAYLAFQVRAGGGADFVRAARTLEIAGFNVTMPLKEELYPLMDSLDPSALGSVNTVINRDGLLTGASTDGDGFLRALASHGREVKGLRTVLLGAGGAARTVAGALAGAGACLSVCVRNKEKARGIAPPGLLFNWEALPELCREAGLLVNATPLGMEGFADFGSLDFLSALPPGAFVFDLIYSPPRTALLREAERLGLDCANGLTHLVHQAALSFGRFTGVEPDGRLVAGALGLCSIRE